MAAHSKSSTQKPLASKTMNNKYLYLTLGYIHLHCINWDLKESVLKLSNNFIPSKVIDIVLSFCRHKYSVHAIGSNKYEEFGDVNMNIRKSHILHNVNIRGFQKCDEFSHLLTSIDSSIYYGRHRFMIFNNNSNEIHVAGHNNLGQCGLNSKELEIDEFTKLKLPSSFNKRNDLISIISNGICAKHAFIVTKSTKNNLHKIYAFGSNKNGQFGTDSKFIQPQIFPLELTSLSDLIFLKLKLTIKQICCGEKHTIFLCTNGKLLGCGLNDQGQCGLEYDEDYEHILEPELIKDITAKIDRISCGREHNLCLDIEGHVWAFGVNTNGELGIGKNKQEFEWIDQPLMINKMFNKWKKHKIKIVSISAGERHSLFIDNNYKLWLCGSNWYCQIGNNKSFTECQKVPYCIQNENKTFKKVKFVDGSCGDYHTVMLDIKNNVYTCGANDSYQCHPPLFNGSDLSKISMPLKIDRKHINIGPYDIISKVLGAASATLLIVE